MDWQPIETAPKDGTRVLAWESDYDEYPLIAHFDREYEAWAHEGYSPDDDPRWRFVPTHWMPLPPPPDSEEAGRATKGDE